MLPLDEVGVGDHKSSSSRASPFLLTWIKSINLHDFFKSFWPKCVAATAVERFGIQGQRSHERKT